MVQHKEEVTELRTKFKNNCRIKEYSTHSSKIHSVDWNCDGRRLASGGFDKSVCIVGLSNDRLSKEVRIFLCICEKNQSTFRKKENYHCLPNTQLYQLIKISDNLSWTWRFSRSASVASNGCRYVSHCIRRSNCKDMGCSFIESCS